MSKLKNALIFIAKLWYKRVISYVQEKISNGFFILDKILGNGVLTLKLQCLQL